MIDFRLDEMQEAVVDAARDFASRELSGDFGESQKSMLGELGFWGLLAPESVGGSELDALSFALVIEELATVSPSVAWLVARHAGPGVALAKALGTLSSAHAEGKELLLVDRPGSVAASSLASNISLLDSGEVFAANENGPAKLLGLDTIEANSFECGDKLEVSADGIVKFFDLARAATLLGIARGSFECGRAYAMERKQFSRSISNFQAIQWKIADSKLGCEGARVTLQQAAFSMDDESLSIAGKLCERAARFAADEALQIHGGYGYTREYLPERFLRAAHQI